MECIDSVLRLASPGAGGRVNPLEFTAEQVADLVGLGVVVGYALRAFFEIILIVTPVQIYAAAVQFHHRIAHSVKEIPIVGHHQQGAAAATQDLLQSLDRLDVQVIGRLVHNEEFGFEGEHLAEGDPLDLAAGERVHPAREAAESEGSGQFCQLDFEAGETVFVHLLQMRSGVGVNLFADAERRVVGVVLLEKGYADVLEEDYPASGVGLVLPGKYPQQRSLARAVRCNQGNLVAFVYIESDILKKNFRAV